MGNYDFTAIVILHNALPQGVETTKGNLTKLGFDVIRVTEVEGKGYLAIGCQIETFEQVFKTKVVKVAPKSTQMGTIPEHFETIAPVIIPDQLEKEVKVVHLPHPPTRF